MKIKSEFGNELEICNFVFDLLRKKNFNVKKVPVDKNGFNVIAKIGKPRICLSAHLDTVKGFLKVRETEDRIFGRGACDTKASVTSMIRAAIECKEEGLENFGLLFTVGEEGSFRGARKIEKEKFNLPFVIVGEPTSLEVINGHFGILNFSVAAKEKKTHSITPQKGINAIERLIKVIKII